MARLVRGDLFHPLESGVYHCLNRAVRRAFLCGVDPLTGKDFSHRRGWMEERLQFLAGQFGIDVLAFAIMSNHFHLVLRNRPEVVAQWPDAEVARRWLRLCPLRKNSDGSPAEPTESDLGTILHVPGVLEKIRLRLSDISWFMRLVAEPIAKRANREDECRGRFWEGRFKSVKLCDEAALLACSVYVDLNPIRAALAESPETSDHTSGQRRCAALQGQQQRVKETARAVQTIAPAADSFLAPVQLRVLKRVAPQCSRNCGPATKDFCP